MLYSYFHRKLKNSLLLSINNIKLDGYIFNTKFSPGRGKRKMKLFTIILASLVISAALCSCSKNQNGVTPITSDKVESTATSRADATATATPDVIIATAIPDVITASIPNATSASTPDVTAATMNSDNSPAVTADKTQESVESVNNTETDYSTLGFELLRKESVGPLKLALSSEDVVKALGEPEEKSDFSLWGSDGLEHQTWIYTEKGIILSIVKTENAVSIESIDLSSPCTYKTSRGIGIGSKKSEVYEAYKQEIDPAENKEDSPFIVAGSVYGGIIFSIENDSVSGIFIGASAE